MHLLNRTVKKVLKGIQMIAGDQPCFVDITRSWNIKNNVGEKIHSCLWKWFKINVNTFSVLFSMEKTYLGTYSVLFFFFYLSFLLRLNIPDFYFIIIISSNARGVQIESNFQTQWNLSVSTFNILSMMCYFHFNMGF